MFAQRHTPRRFRATDWQRQERLASFLTVFVGCTSAGSGPPSPPTDAPIDGFATADVSTNLSDAAAATCSVYPYPQGMACDDSTQVCIPEAGFDCCRCLSTTFCKYPKEWACESSDPGCPPTPPTIGAPCALRQYAGCLYCYLGAVIVDCSDGKWQQVDNHLYCPITD